MKSYARATLASCLCLVSVQGTAGGANTAPPAVNAKKLENGYYASAREIILRNGWKPLGGICEGVLADTCAKFPEIDVCSGVYPGYCDLKFFRRNRCLFVLTIGGWPGDKYTQVKDVTFRRGRCVKNVSEPVKLR